MGSVIHLERDGNWLAWGAIFLIHGLLVVLTTGNHSFIPDERAYFNLAQNLVEEGRYTLDFESFWHAPGQPNTYYAPGWPALLALGYMVAGTTGCWILLWGVWCVNSVLISVLGRECHLSPWNRWVLVGWLTCNPLYGYYHGHLMTETAVLAFVLATVVLGIRFVREATVARAIALGVVSAAANLTRTQTMLPVMAIGLLSLALVPWKRLIPLGALLVAVHLVLVGPWLGRMVAVGATPFATELKTGSALYAYSGVFGNAYTLGPTDISYPPDIDRMTPGERDRVLRKAALAAITERPGAYWRTNLVRVQYLFSPLPNFHRAGWVKSIGMFGATALFFYVPLALVVAGLLKQRPRDRAAWVLLCSIALWYLFHILVHASVRQRLPSDALVATLAMTLWFARPPGFGQSADVPAVETGTS